MVTRLKVSGGMAALGSALSFLLLPNLSQAQQESAGKTIVGNTGKTILRSLPASGRMRLPRALELPAKATRPLSETGRNPASASDPILYNSRQDIDGDGFISVLWGFPTIGLDSTKNPDFISFFEQTLDTRSQGAASTMLLQFGQPTRISRVVYRGVLTTNATFPTGTTGTLGFLFFDGVDAGTPPDLAGLSNLATTVSGAQAFFVVRFNTANGITTWATDFDIDSIKINDPQGRAGLIIAKVEDTTTPSAATVAWYTPVGYATGPNLTWDVTAATGQAGLTTIGADVAFNQGLLEVLNPAGDTILANPPYNFNLQIRGKKGDGTLATTGSIRGNLRDRGTELPSGLDANGLLEGAPRSYAVSFFAAGTSTLKRTDFLYTLPSYNAASTLINNYQIDGIPTGTYDVLVQQLPITHFPETGPAITNILRDLNVFPFADMVPALIENVVVTSNGLTTVNARLERYGDIDDGTETDTPDESVDAFDLARIISAFNTVEGDEFFNINADIAGDDAVDNGIPDNSVDAFDLAAVITAFNTGNLEVP